LVLTTLGIVLVCALLTWLVAFSSVFGVRSVEVRGVHLLSAAKVRAAADIGSGTPLVRLDTGAVVRRVEALPEVASAKVNTSFPSTVRIEVTERVAVGMLAGNGNYVLVDRTGVQFRTVTTAPKSLPTFVLPSGTAARSTGAALARVAAALPAGLRARVASIQALEPTAITLLLTDQRVVRWGSAQDSAEKARVLGALLAQPAPAGAAAPTQFDVSDPAQPFAR
jgi:cell division protein FtsQ